MPQTATVYEAHDARANHAYSERSAYSIPRSKPHDGAGSATVRSMATTAPDRGLHAKRLVFRSHRVPRLLAACSFMSVLSLLSIGCGLSVGSIVSVGSVFSVASIGSICSINSVFAIGCIGESMKVCIDSSHAPNDVRPNATTCSRSRACGSSVHDECVIIQADCATPSRRRVAFADVARSIDDAIEAAVKESAEYVARQRDREAFRNSPTTAYWFSYGDGSVAWNTVTWTPDMCPVAWPGDAQWGSGEEAQGGSGGYMPLSRDVLRSNCSIGAFEKRGGLACECVFYEVETGGKVTSLRNAYGNSLMPLLIEKVNGYEDLWERPNEAECRAEFAKPARQREIALYYQRFASSSTRAEIQGLQTTNATNSPPYVYNSSNEFARVLCNGMLFDDGARAIYVLDYVVRDGQLFYVNIKERDGADVAPGCAGIDWGTAVSPSRYQIVYIGLLVQLMAKFLLKENITALALSYQATPIAELGQRANEDVACQPLPDGIDTVVDGK